MDIETASQIYVAGNLIVFGLSNIKWGAFASFIFSAVAILLPAWFAWVADLWPFYFLSVFMATWFVTGIVKETREALNASDNA